MLNFGILSCSEMSLCGNKSKHAFFGAALPRFFICRLRFVQRVLCVFAGADRGMPTRFRVGVFFINFDKINS